MNAAARWLTEHWIIPETLRPVELRPWQLAFLEAAFPDQGEPVHETYLISTVKKGMKTTTNAMATLYATLTFPAPETAFIVANDADQAQERVFDLIAWQLRRLGWDRAGEATITRSEIVFPETGSRILALPADFAGAAGAIFGISSWTELWAFRYEQHIRLWEELTPIPHRRTIRIVDSYAGFAADSPILEPLWDRAVKGARIHSDLPIYSTGRLWAFVDVGEEAQRRAWRGDPAGLAPYYAEQAASLRPGTYNRLHLNLWQTGAEAFIRAVDWDECVVPGLGPEEPNDWASLWVGVDAATKSDSAAVVAVGRTGDGRLRLARHRIWAPRAGEVLDLHDTIEAFLVELARRYHLAAVVYDPFQMAAIASSLRARGLPMEEFPQTVGNLTAAGQNLYELIRGRGLLLYPDEELRQHALNAVALDTGRGWRIAKEKASRKIDGLAALSFAALGAARVVVVPSQVQYFDYDRYERALAMGAPEHVAERLAITDVEPQPVSISPI